MRSRIVYLLPLMLAAMACGGGRPPNVLVIVIDTLRADRLGVYGNPRALTPFLDELAQRGTVFANAYASSSWTIPSVASLMTSRYPSQHHVIGFGNRLRDQEVTIAEALQPLGYIAGGFSANFQLLERYGYAQGFQFWRADPNQPKKLPAADLRQHSLEWLDTAWHAGDARPALLYFQFMEPHSPYDPPDQYRSRPRGSETDAALAFASKLKSEGVDRITRADLREFEQLYDGEVRAVDDEIRTLIAELRRRGFLDDAIVVVTADHGEEFWEHHGTEHGKTLYNETVRVPLILVAPGYRGGQRVETNVSLVDVGPTLLALLGRPPQPSFEGRSLVPLLERSSVLGRLSAWFRTRLSRPADADIIMQLEPKTGDKYDDRQHVEAIIRGSSKLLVRRDGGRETYDLAADPEEQQSVDGIGATLTSALADANKDLTRRSVGTAQKDELDEATKEKLRALGYHP